MLSQYLVKEIKTKRQSHHEAILKWVEPVLVIIPVTCIGGYYSRSMVSHIRLRSRLSGPRWTGSLLWLVY